VPGKCGGNVGQIGASETNMNNIDIYRFIRLLKRHEETDTILFLQPELSKIILPAVNEGGNCSFYIAIQGITDNMDKLDFPSERFLDSLSVGFIDKIKIITKGSGFHRVLVMNDDPLSVKQALGAAALFGDIYLLLPISQEVVIDLTATINFKSLRIHGKNLLGESPKHDKYEDERDN